MFPQIQHRETDKDYSVKTPSASENALSKKLLHGSIRVFPFILTITSMMTTFKE